MLGANPQDNMKCENALLHLPFSARRHIHDLCVKALVPGGDDAFSEQLFRYYAFSASTIENDCPHTADDNGSDQHIINRLDLYKGMTQIFERVTAELKKYRMSIGKQ